MNLMHTIKNLYSINEDKDIENQIDETQRFNANKESVEVDLDALFEEELGEVDLEEAINAKEKGRLSFKFGKSADQNPYKKGSDDAKDWSAGYSAAKAAEKKRDPRYQAK